MDELAPPFQSIRSAFLAAALLEFFAGSAGAGIVSAGGFDGVVEFEADEYSKYQNTRCARLWKVE